MRIAGAKLYAYKLPLRSALRSSRASISEREGFMLLLEGADGERGIGEAAPVYWLDGESLELVGRALGILVAELDRARVESERLARGLSAPSGDSSASEAAILDELRSSRSPAALCALDSALLDLRGRSERRRACEFLSSLSVDRCRLARLLTKRDSEALAEEARVALGAGVVTLKLKVGADAVAADVARVQALRAAGGSRLRLRLDANRGWSFADARGFLAAIGPECIDYIEEPLADADAESLAELRAVTRVSVAVDESLRDHHDLQRFATASSCDVVVVKIARLGGPNRALAIARAASAYGLRVVFTDSIETVVGCAATLHTALAHSATPEPLGLGGGVLLGGPAPLVPSWRDAVRVDGPGLGVDASAVLAALR